MNRINISGTVPRSSLNQVGVNTYELVVKFFVNGTDLLVDARIPNPYKATVVMTTDNFTISVPVQDYEYAISGVTIRVYANSETDCCFGSILTNFQPEGKTSFLLAGTYSESRPDLDLLYTWIPSQNVSVSILPNGNISVTTPTTRSSINGANVCNRFIADENNVPIDDHVRTTMFSPTGIGVSDAQGSLSLDHYTFLIMYYNAPQNDWNFVNNNPWLLAANAETYQSNSGLCETLAISIEKLSEARL